MVESPKVPAASVLCGHADEDTAHLVDDYPYGFRVRTSIRYWVETVPRRGDRFCSQTLNPKTGRWNKPKKSTYYPLGGMYLSEDGHVTWSVVNEYSQAEYVHAFLAWLGEAANDNQRAQAALILAAHKVWANVTTTIHEGAFSDEEWAEQDALKRRIGGAIVGEARRILPTI